jgi:hypothetical protein
MVNPPQMARAPWAPVALTLVHETKTQNSTCPSHVLFDGDQPHSSQAFIKTLGNPEGADALVCEHVGTMLARWLGLETCEMAIFDMPERPQLKYREGFVSLRGPAFASRFAEGKVWDGTSLGLKELANPETIPGLVLFDTWTRNLDRFGERGGETRRNERNVYIAWRNRAHRLVALDQSACFGRFVSDWVRRMRCIDEKKDCTVYGLFPEFVPYVTHEKVRPYLERLAAFRKLDMLETLAAVPAEWIERPELREALTEFCVERAAFLRENAEALLGEACTWQSSLPFPDGGAA